MAKLSQLSSTQLNTLIVRVAFGFAAMASAVAIANALFGQFTAPPGLKAVLIAVYLVIAVCGVLAMRLPPQRAQAFMLPLVLASLAVVTCAGLTTGWGLRTPGLYFLSVMCCLVGVIGSRRQAMTVMAMAGATVLILAGAEWRGVVPTLAAPGMSPPLARALVLMAAIVIGGGVGVWMASLVRAFVREAGEREARFRDLLGIAATSYWETDAQLRIHQVSTRNAKLLFIDLPMNKPAAPWDLPTLHIEAQVMDRLRAAMQAREPLRDVPVRWQDGTTEPSWLLVSGEPRLDAAGQFTGYWGVARDVSAEHRARDALLDTELRYRKLFQHTPTPMLLHIDGHIIDANPAAATMFGFDSSEQMRAAYMPDFYAEPDRSRVLARLHQLVGLAVGDALPLAAYSLRRRDGKQLFFKSTGVRTDVGGRAALLTIYIDETSQHAATLAQQRSEALLRQVLATSPDVITLTDLDSGHYEMVNDSFARITGRAASDVLGRTAMDVGIWASQDDRDRLINALATSDTVKDMSVRFVHQDGHGLPMLVSAARFHREGKRYLVINARDESQSNRLHIEREAILANASVGIALTRDRRFAHVNPKFGAIFGWPPEELIGQTVRTLWHQAADFDSFFGQVMPPLQRGEQVTVERGAVRRSDGAEIIVQLRAKAIDPRNPATSGTIWIAEDVTAQRQAQADLARARDQAEAANRAKSDFLANTSHEIRTPLNGLVGLARMARQPGVPTARLHQYLEQIGTSAQTLSMIISDILDLSKIEAGKLQLESAPFDLLALLDSLRLAYSALAESHGLALSVEQDPKLPKQVLGDALRVRQILVNYLHNAMKFTVQGSVSLHAMVVAGERLRFEVSDTGPGIDAATQARLFKPFTQGDESITRRYGGTGLGLSICRELAELMGGSVGLHSVAGQGSQFHVELPLPVMAMADVPAAAQARDADRLRGVRVLLVEDNPVNMMIAVALLEQWGMQVTQAEDGVGAIQATEGHAGPGQPFDVVLMDLQMPGMSGHEATQQLRQRWTPQQLPVIALTAAALVSEREQAMAAGMNDFVTKPIEPQRLQQALCRALAFCRPNFDDAGQRPRP